MWILHTDGRLYNNARQEVREFMLPELPRYSVDDYCAENKTVYEFLEFFTTAVNVNRYATTRH